jgi:hypothetical protein
MLIADILRSQSTALVGAVSCSTEGMSRCCTLRRTWTTSLLTIRQYEHSMWWNLLFVFRARFALRYRITTRSTRWRARKVLVSPRAHSLMKWFFSRTVQYSTDLYKMLYPVAWRVFIENRYMYCAANPTIQYNEHDRLALVRANSSFERAAWKFT